MDEVVLVQQVEIPPEMLEELKEQRRLYLEELGRDLEAKKDECIAWRSTTEHMWIDAERQYMDGITPLAETKGNDYSTTEPYIRAVDNITRTNTKAITARAQNMLFPTFEKNFDLEVSAKAKARMKEEIMAALAERGINPDKAQSQIDASFSERVRREEVKVDNLERMISDILASSSYSKHGRDCLDDGVTYGTGIIEGPFSKIVMRDRFDPITHSMVMDVTVEQSVQRVDPWNFFPQPSRHIRECEYAFVLHLMTKTQVKALADQADIGFDPEQIRLVLEKGSELGKLGVSPMSTRGGQDGKILKDRFPIWKYVGPVPDKCLKYFGIDEKDELSPPVCGEMWFCNGIVIRAAVSITKTSNTLPFYIWNFESNPDSLFGYGVPHIIRMDQQSANITWSAAQLNAMMSAAPIYGVVKEMIEAQGSGQIDLRLTRPQTVLLNNTNDVRSAISAFVTPSNISHSLEIFDRAKANANEHTMLPAFIQGGNTQSVTTSSGMALMMNDSNIVQKQMAASWDDEVTLRLLPKMIAAVLDGCTDDSIICDADVIPKGASHLLVKDMRLQHNMTLLAMADNPNNAPYLNRERLLKAIISDLDQPSDTVLNSKEETDQIMASTQQQPNPEVMKLELQAKEQEMKLQSDREQRAFEMQREIIRQKGAIYVAQLNHDAAMAKAAADERVSIEEVRSKLMISERDGQVQGFLKSLDLEHKREESAIKSQDSRFKAGMDAELKSQEIADRAQSRAVQVATESPIRIAQ